MDADCKKQTQSLVGWYVAFQKKFERYTVSSADSMIINGGVNGNEIQDLKQSP